MSSIDLISLKIQILGGKVLFKNLGFESQWGRVKFFAIFLFSSTFFILTIKNWILKHCILTGYIEIKLNLFNIPIFNWWKKIKKKDFMCQYSVVYGEYENEKKTGQKNLTFPDVDLNPGLLNKFPPIIWILREIRSIELTVLKKSRLYLFYSIQVFCVCSIR